MGNIDTQNLLGSMQQDPSGFASMINNLAMNPDIQQQFGNQNLGMLQSFASQLQMYNPQNVEYDDEQPEGETDEVIMLSSDPIPQELGTVMKVGNGPKFCPAVPEHIGEKDDDEIIDYFLN